MKTYICTCCGSDVTAPYFYKGGVYGWTCIKKVNPAVKRTKNKAILATDSLEVFRSETRYVPQGFRAFIVTVNGKRFLVDFNSKIGQEPYKVEGGYVVPDDHGKLSKMIGKVSHLPVPFV